MYRLLLLVIFLVNFDSSMLRAGETTPAKTVKLFADEAWYKGRSEKEQLFEGVLTKANRGGGIGFGRFNPFRLVMKNDTREVYMGGRLKVLERYVGARIRMRGKAVDLGVEGQRHREIWPSGFVVLAKSGGPEGKIEAAIKKRLAGKGNNLSGMRLDVMWGGRGSATVYGNGVGIWNREKQFNLDKTQRLSLLKILNDGKFVRLKSGYGGLPRPIGGPAIGAPEVLVGNITLTLGKVSKSSMQRGGGEQSKELAALAGKLLDVCQQAAQNGVTAKDLSDGLQKIAAGKLHPLTLSVLVQRIENEGRGPNGWILRINGHKAEVQLRSKNGISSPIHLKLTEKQLDQLCRLLLKNDAAGLPINLYARDYTDFRVSIFRARKSLQARKFARLTPTTHGKKQQNFNRIFTALDSLQKRIVKDGKRHGIGVMRQTGFIVNADPKPRTLVLKSANALKKVIDAELSPTAKRMNLADLDFSKYMVVLIKSGQTNAFGVRITVDKVELAPTGKSAIIHWTYRPYLGGARPPNRPGNPGTIALIERFDGKMTFQKKFYRRPRGLPLPPSAGPGGPVGRPTGPPRIQRRLQP